MSALTASAGTGRLRTQAPGIKIGAEPQRYWNRQVDVTPETQIDGAQIEIGGTGC